MVDIVEEVMDDKKDEQKMQYFKKSIPIVLALTVIVIIMMLINDYRSNNAKSHNAEIGDTIVKSLENLNTDLPLTIEGLDFVVKNAKNHAKDIAVLQLLALKISAKDYDKALDAINDILHKEQDYLDITKAYAKLMWISLMLDAPQLSDEEISLMKKYFDSYTDKTPFYGSAHLLEALWYKKTDKKKSMEIAQNLLSNKAVTNTIKEESKALISNLTIEN